MTCDQAVSLASQVEEAIAEAKSIEGAAISQVVFEVARVDTTGSIPAWKQLQSRSNAGSRLQPVPWCGNCGLRHCLGGLDCPARGKECLSCVYRKITTLVVADPRKECPEGRLQSIEGTATDEGVVLHMLDNPKSGGYKTCECLIGQAKIKLVIDLGAKVSVLNEVTYKQFLSDTPLASTLIKLVGVNGSGRTLASSAVQTLYSG